MSIFRPRRRRRCSTCPSRGPPSAAWLVMPPRAVRIPSAARMPSTSSGLVSSRTRMTFSPFLRPLATAVGRSEHDLAACAAGARWQDPTKEGRRPVFSETRHLMIGCKQFIELRRLDAGYGNLLVDQFLLLQHVHGHVQELRCRSACRCGTGACRACRLGW